MEKKYRPGYKALLTSLTIATILTNTSIHNVHATEEPFVNQIDVEKVILDKQLEKDLGIVDAPTDESFFNFDAWTGTITGYDTAGGVDVVIPKVIRGVEVKSIGNRAFYEKGVISVVIPDSVTSIGHWAFGINQLTELIIPDSVTSIGDSAFNGNQLTELIIPDSVTHLGGGSFAGNQLQEVEISENITKIEDSVFGWNQITKVTIPNSVRKIGEYAFVYNQLKNVIIPDNVVSIGRSAFHGNQLTEVIIPDSVTNLGEHAFYSNQLNKITLPKGITSISEGLFNDNNLTELIIPDSVINIGNSAFESNQLTELIIPDSVTSIGDSAFNSNQLTKVILPEAISIINSGLFNNNQLTEVVIPDSVTNIGDSAFSSNQLIELIIPDSVINIGDSAFRSNQLTEVVIPDSVTSIGDYAFDSNQLTELIISDSVTSIGAYAFDSNQLTELIISDSVTSIGAYAFYGNQLTELIIPDSVINIGNSAFRSNQLTELIISDSVTSIGAYAFTYNQLTELNIPDSVINIGDRAFFSNQLTELTIPDSVTSIGSNAFSNNQLTEVNIPDSVRSLGSQAFYNNSSLKKATIPSSVVFMGADIFKYTSPNLLLYGESGSRAESYAKTFNHKFIEMIVKDEIQTEEVAFEIEYVKNPDLLVGTEEVSQEGVNGIHTIIERVTLIGGEETNRKLILNEVTTDPVNKVIQVGVKEVIEESRTEEVAFEIEYVNNPGLMVGTEEVSQEGTNGVRTIIEKVTIVEGKETGREVVSSEITTDPVSKVIQVGTKEVTEETRTQEVAFEIEYVNNPDLLVGTEEVSQEGVLGERTIVEKVTTVGGEETAREVISDEITTAPVNKVIQVGTKAAPIEDIATVVSEETRTQEVAFEIEYVNNPDLLVGTEEVSQEGVLGERTIVEKVTTVGGEETAREVISDEITTAPVNKVIQVGTKAAPIEDIATVVSEETRTQEVAFEIEYVNNPDLLVGTEEVSQEGVLGERTIVEKVTTVGGEETAREVISDEITTAPVNKVIQVGTKAAPIEDIATVVSEETRTQEVAFEIEYVNNPDLLVGTEEVSQEGVLGERTIVEKVTTVGGEETGREMISDEITTAPVKKVVQVGTKAVKEESRTEELPFEIEYVNNPNLLIGTEKVSQEGVVGILTIIEEVTTIDGEEANRKVLSEEVTTAPVKKVVQVGTKAAVIEDIAKIKDGWKKEDNNWVYYKDNEKLNGWQFINSHWYFMDTSGYMKTDWTQIGSTWYYLSGSGAMQTGWTKVDNTWYYLSGSGAMQTGWTKVGNTWYYMNSSGAMQTGWTKVGNTWYYMNSSGAMQTGWTKVGNTWYYMNSSGAMQTGWTKVGSTWYYMNSSGAMQTGWLKLGQNWYFLNNNGSMQLQNKTINGKWYRFDSSGRML